MDKTNFVVAEEREGYPGIAHDFEKMRQINRELVNALELIEEAEFSPSCTLSHIEKLQAIARNALAKAKGEA